MKKITCLIKRVKKVKCGGLFCISLFAVLLFNSQKNRRDKYKECKRVLKEKKENQAIGLLNGKDGKYIWNIEIDRPAECLYKILLQ